MEIIEINPHYIEKVKMQRIVSILRKGGVIVYPTDTLYGLGADMKNMRAVRKVFQIKGRRFSKPLSILLSKKKEIGKYATIHSFEKALIHKYFPGKVTLIAKKRKTVPDIVTAGNDTIGVRIQTNRVAQMIVEMLGAPMTSTSANISGRKDVLDPQEIVKVFEKRKNRPDAIISIGKLKSSKSSTIVQVVNGKLKIHRQGAVQVKL